MTIFIKGGCAFKKCVYNQNYQKQLLTWKEVITITFFESKHKKQKKIFFYLYVIMITFRALEEFVKEKLPAFGDEKRDYILSVKLSRLQIIRREFV